MDNKDFKIQKSMFFAILSSTKIATLIPIGKLFGRAE